MFKEDSESADSPKGSSIEVTLGESILKEIKKGNRFMVGMHRVEPAAVGAKPSLKLTQHALNLAETFDEYVEEVSDLEVRLWAPVFELKGDEFDRF